MPELPEVEAARKLAEPHVRGKTIESVATANDRIVFHGVAPRSFARALAGRTVHAICRRGKQLWMEMDRPPHPGFHFGMTGSFHVYEDKRDRPRFWKVELRFDDGTRLAMRNVRRLGRIRLFGDPLREPPVNRMGFDPLLNLPNTKDLAAELARRHTPIKALLLNQSFAAGVGNWIADEVLYQSGIAPYREAASLADRRAGALRTALKRVIEKAVAVDADSRRFPRTWLFHHRWGKKAHACTARGERIQFDTIGGRTTAWVPARQR